MLPRISSSQTWAVALAAVAFALGPGAGSASAVPRTFWGAQMVNGIGDVPQYSQAELEHFQSARLGTLRMHFDWSAVEPHRGTPRDWSGYDRTVAAVTATGTRILGMLIGSPRFAARRPTYPPRSSANVRRWQRFVRDVVARYGNGGKFWDEHPELPYRPVKYWQVHNEPNYPHFWFERPRAREYAKYLAQTSPVIRRTDPDARIAIGGLPNVANSGGNVSARMEDYLAQLYRSSRRVRGDFDIVAIHPYSVDYRGVLGALSRVKRVMNRYRDGRTPIWITELGWATYSRGFNATGYSGQASHLTATFRAVLRVRRRYRLLGLIWYSWRDVRPSDRDWWGLHCGLFTVGQHAKPSWRAFTHFTRATS